jgi:uncharacterized OsmC-like protein
MSQETVKDALQKTIAAIKANPANGKVVFEAATRLKQDVLCAASVRQFAPMMVDEPPELGGTDTAMNPAELLLVALGACQEIVYAAYSAFLGVALDEVKVTLKGDLDARGMFGLDPSVPPGYQRITYETGIRTAADEATIRKLVQVVEGHCPLLDTIKRPIDVVGSVILNGRPLGQLERRAA